MTRSRRAARTGSNDAAGFEPLTFPDADEQRLADGGRSSQRWRALLEHLAAMAELARVDATLGAPGSAV